MSEEKEYEVEFEDPTKPGSWIPVSGATYKHKKRAETRSKREAEKLGVETRVTRRIPVWEEWNFSKLTSRLGGTTPAVREMKKRGEAGAIAAWAIYKQHIKNLLRLACGAGPEGKFARDPAFRTTLISDLEAVGEDDLIKQIDGLWKKHPKGIPQSDLLDLQDTWDETIERMVGKRIPRTPDELTKEDIEESKKVTRKLHELKLKQTPEEKLDGLEQMKKELEEKMEKLKKDLK